MVMLQNRKMTTLSIKPLALPSRVVGVSQIYLGRNPGILDVFGLGP
jgi:hypothetical protein